MTLNITNQWEWLILLMMLVQFNDERSAAVNGALLAGNDAHQVVKMFQRSAGVTGTLY